MQRLRIVIALVLMVAFVTSDGAVASAEGHSCVGLSAPIDGEITEPYAPIGRYGGHWGVDYAATAPNGTDSVEGPPVTAAASGVVTFSGLVVDNRTVTVDHGGGLKTSYSYLTEAAVQRGDWVGRGARIGSSAVDGEHDAVHFSLRIDGVYVDPQPRIGCRRQPPSAGLSLVPAP